METLGRLVETFDRMAVAAGGVRWKLIRSEWNPGGWRVLMNAGDGDHDYTSGDTAEAALTLAIADLARQTQEAAAKAEQKAKEARDMAAVVDLHAKAAP